MNATSSRRLLAIAACASMMLPQMTTAKGSPLVARPNCINLLEVQNNIAKVVGSPSSSSRSTSSKAARPSPRQKPTVSVGVTVGYNGGRYYLTSVAPGSAAEQAGLLPGDEIRQIEGRDTGSRFTAQSLVDALNGPEGSSVKLEVGRQKDGGIVPITLVRKQPAKMADYEVSVDGGIAYLKVRAFSPPVAKAVRAWLETDAVKASRGIVLDVRTNPTGDAASLFNMLSNFLPKGTAMGNVLGPSVSIPITSAQSSASAASAPLVVLANEGGMINVLVRYTLVIKRTSPPAVVITEAESLGKNAISPNGLSFAGLAGKDAPQQYCSEMATFTWDLLYKGELLVKPEVGIDAPLARAKALLNK